MKIKANYLILKITAIITMIIGDLSYLLIHRLNDSWIMVMTAIGNLSFPLFAFILTETFLKQSDKNNKSKNYKYKLIMLLLLALISEIPFNVFLSGSIRYPLKNNVCFTLFSGFLMLILLDKDYYGFFFNYYKDKKVRLGFKKYSKKKSRRFNFYVKTIIISGFMLGNYLIANDYSYTGILLIALFYLLRNKKKLRAVIPIIILILSEANILYIPVLIDMILIALYDNKRMNISKPVKYGLRIIYPVFISIMAVLSLIL